MISPRKQTATAPRVKREHHQLVYAGEIGVAHHIGIHQCRCEACVEVKAEKKNASIFWYSDNDSNFNAVGVQENCNANTKVSHVTFVTMTPTTPDRIAIDLAKKTGEECKQTIGINSEGPL
jgi:hypothetical protein